MGKKMRNIDRKGTLEGVLDIAAYFDERSKLTLVKNYYEAVEEKTWSSSTYGKASLCKLEKLIAMMSRTTGEILATIPQEHQKKDCTQISNAINYLVEETFGCIIEAEEDRLSFRNFLKGDGRPDVLFFRLSDFFPDGKINPFLGNMKKGKTSLFHLMPEKFFRFYDGVVEKSYSKSFLKGDGIPYVAFEYDHHEEKYYPFAFGNEEDDSDYVKVPYLPNIFGAKWGDDDSTNVVGSIESGDENLNYFLRTANKRYLVPGESYLNWLHFAEVMKHYKP